MAGNARQLFIAAAKGTIAETQQAFVALAKTKHAEVMAADPKPQRFTRTVDGRLGAAEETVMVGGVIRYNYHRLEDVVRFAMETLFDLSPVLSGEYRNAHQIFVNGEAVANLAKWDGMALVVITNPMPYARKIEIGSMTMTVSGTDQVYEEAASIVAKRFGNAVRVVFMWQGVVQGAAVKSHAGNKAKNRYPALRIEAR